MTYRERRERRVDRLRGWADGRERRSQESYDRSREIGSHIPLGQPILVGHHSERRHRRDIERIDNAMRDSVESSRMASSMRSRADNIEAALAGDIYDDDPDAIERLKARIEALEAKRAERKAANAAYRKEHRAELKAMTPYERSQAVPFPSYHLSNLSGNIKRNRDRLDRLQRAEKARAADADEEWESGEVTVRVTSWRVEIHFPGKPSAEVRDGLKSHGFRWDRVGMHWWARSSYTPSVDYARETFPREEAA